MSIERSPASWWRNSRSRLNPTATGGPMSLEVSKIRQGNNPHEHSLAEAVAIAQKKIIYESNQSPSKDSED